MSKAPKAAPASDRISDFGLEAICNAIGDGLSMTEIAAQIGISVGTLSTWLSADPERSAPAREARRETARIWDEMAEATIKAAKDQLDVQKARELAQHYRWRSSKINPRDYGDKIDLNHSGELAVKALPDDKLESRLADLLGKTGAIGALGGEGAAEG